MLRRSVAALSAGIMLVASIMPVSAQGYDYDQYGRSMDPNCYRGPNQVYVCGGPRDGGYRRRGYAVDEYGRSTDPNCYRGPRQVYVCGGPQGGDGWGGGYRRRGYAIDEYGRSTDPNCYRGPRRVYVC